MEPSSRTVLALQRLCLPTRPATAQKLSGSTQPHHLLVAENFSIHNLIQGTSFPLRSLAVGYSGSFHPVFGLSWLSECSGRCTLLPYRGFSVLLRLTQLRR